MDLEYLIDLDNWFAVLHLHFLVDNLRFVLRMVSSGKLEISLRYVIDTIHNLILTKVVFLYT